MLTATDGATLYLPKGDYEMQTWQTLTGGTKWAFRMDGVITRASESYGQSFLIYFADREIAP